MGGPCECFHHVYAHLLDQHIGVVLTDGHTEIWGDLEGVDGEGLAVRDSRTLINTIHRTVIGHVLLANGAKAAPYDQPADIDATHTATPAATRPDGEADHG
jgi:hypothetical protein